MRRKASTSRLAGFLTLVIEKGLPFRYMCFATNKIPKNGKAKRCKQTVMRTNSAFKGFIAGMCVHLSTAGISPRTAGGLLLREVEQGQQFIEKFSQCFTDLRNPRFTEHSVTELLSQRVYGLCFGNEDLNDHDQLRSDPLLALLCGKKDLEGKGRKNERDRGRPLAGKSTLNRLETAGSLLDKRPRYKKIVAHTRQLEEFFARTFLRTTKKTPRLLILDFDATDDPLHGKQEGRFFHGYYDCYCYLPLYVFCGDQLLWGQLRKSDIDSSDGALEVLQRLVKMIRHKWPLVKILIRADSGFCPG